MVSEKFESVPASSLFFIFLFFFSIGFIIFSFIKTPFTNPIMLIPPLIMVILFIVTVWGNWVPVSINPNFLTDSGVVGTVYNKKPIILTGNRIAYDICIFKRDLPNNIHRRMTKGIAGMFSFLAGSIIVRVTAPAHSWRWIEGKNLETECGCLQLMGRIDGSQIDSRFKIYNSTIRRMNNDITIMSNELENIQSQLSNLSQMKTKDMNKMSEELETIAKRVKNIQLIPRGSGDMGSIID